MQICFTWIAANWKFTHSQIQRGLCLCVWRDWRSFVCVAYGWIIINNNRSISTDRNHRRNQHVFCSSIHPCLKVAMYLSHGLEEKKTILWIPKPSHSKSMCVPFRFHFVSLRKCGYRVNQKHIGNNWPQQKLIVIVCLQNAPALRKFFFLEWNIWFCFAQTFTRISKKWLKKFTRRSLVSILHALMLSIHA